MKLISAVYHVCTLGVPDVFVASNGTVYAAVRPPAAQSGSPMKQAHSGIESVDDLDVVEDVQTAAPQQEEVPKAKTEICCKNCGSHDVTVVSRYLAGPTCHLHFDGAPRAPTLTITVGRLVTRITLALYRRFLVPCRRKRRPWSVRCWRRSRARSRAACASCWW